MITRARHAFILFLILAGGCGDDAIDIGEPPRFAVPGCEELEAAPCDTREAACQSRLFRVAACLRNDELTTPPPVRVITEAELTDELTQNAAGSMRPNPDRFEIALRMLGLVEAGALQPSSMVAENAKQIYGYYDPETDEIVVVDHGGESFDASGSETLVHEAIHALQDRAVDLTAFFDQHNESADSFLAARAIVEGEATFHDTRYVAYVSGLDPKVVDWTRRFSESLDRDEDVTLMHPSRFVAGKRAFPYDAGARYVHFAWRTDGQQSIDNQFAMPPASTHTLMASVDAPFSPEVTKTLPPPPSSPSEWTVVEQTTLGAWNVFLELAPAMDADAAHELALNWRGDQIFVYSRTTPDSTAVVWKIDFADDATAEAAMNIARTRMTGGVAARLGSQLTLAASSIGDPIDWAF